MSDPEAAIAEVGVATLMLTGHNVMRTTLIRRTDVSMLGKHIGFSHPEEK